MGYKYFFEDSPEKDELGLAVYLWGVIVEDFSATVVESLQYFVLASDMDDATDTINQVIDLEVYEIVKAERLGRRVFVAPRIVLRSSGNDTR